MWVNAWSNIVFMFTKSVQERNIVDKSAWVHSMLLYMVIKYFRKFSIFHTEVSSSNPKCHLKDVEFTIAWFIIVDTLYTQEIKTYKFLKTAI